MHGDLSSIVSCDVETRSRCDLESCGSEKYAQHPTTEVLILKYKRGTGPVRQWRPGDLIPADFVDPRCTFVAVQSSGFEILIFRYILTPRFGFPSLPDERWECVSAMAAYAGLPQGLSKMSTRLDLGAQSKDAGGHLNMLRLCKPLGAELVDGEFVGGEFDNHPVRHARNRLYCEQDVVAEFAAFVQLPRLPQMERDTWLLHRKINSRGVPVDLDLCYGARNIIKIAAAKYLDELKRVSGGKITTIDQRERILEFAAERGVSLCLKPDGDDDDPDASPNTREETLTALVPTIENPEVRRIIEIRQLLTAAAVKKYQAVIDWADDDWRCRGFSTYYGAGPGRWSGTQAQFQNLKRPDHKGDLIEEALPYIQRGDYDAAFALSKGDVLGLLSSTVRSILKAEDGNDFRVSDFASVEARKVAWLAGEENLLEPFRRNEDLYVKMACEILGCNREDVVDLVTGKPANPEQKRRRQIGKCPFLGCGYQMGWGHLIEVARKQAGVDLTEELARAIVDTFRGNYPKIPEFWRDIENGAKECVRSRRTIHHPKFRFRMFGDWLIMRIPSGRELFYWQPRFELNERGREQLVYLSTRGPKQLYGGLLTENITQASSRDLLVDAMHRAEAAGLNVVMHCHDELVDEGPTDDGERASILHWCMTQVAPWAEGMPMAAETHACHRYSK
jgi:DNA polymerase